MVVVVVEGGRGAVVGGGSQSQLKMDAKKIRNDYKQKANNCSFDGKNSNLFFSFSDVRMLLTPPPPLRPTLSCFARPRPGGVGRTSFMDAP